MGLDHARERTGLPASCCLLPYFRRSGTISFPATVLVLVLVLVLRMLLFLFVFCAALKYNTSADTITNFLTQIGILRAACGVFPISVRNSPAAVAHLLTKMNITHLLVGPETPYQDLAAAAFQIMQKQEMPVPGTSTMLAFEDIVREEGEAFEPLPDMDVTWDDPSIVQHSSGHPYVESNASTSIPDPTVSYPM